MKKQPYHQNIHIPVNKTDRYNKNTEQLPQLDYQKNMLINNLKQRYHVLKQEIDQNHRILNKDEHKKKLLTTMNIIKNLNITLNRLWTREDVESFYCEAFIDVLNYVPLAKMIQYLKNEIVKTQNKNSFYFTIKKDIEKRNRLLSDLKIKLSNIEQNQFFTLNHLRQICKDLQNLRLSTLIIIQNIVEWQKQLKSIKNTADKYQETEDVQFLFNRENYLKTMLNDHKFIVESFMNRFIIFSKSPDPLFIRPYKIITSKQQSVMDNFDSVVKLFNLSVDFVYRLNEAQIILQKQRNSNNALSPLIHKNKNIKELENQVFIQNSSSAKFQQRSKIRSEDRTNKQKSFTSRLQNSYMHSLEKIHQKRERENRLSEKYNYASIHDRNQSSPYKNLRLQTLQNKDININSIQENRKLNSKQINLKPLNNYRTEHYRQIQNQKKYSQASVEDYSNVKNNDPYQKNQKTVKLQPIKPKINNVAVKNYEKKFVTQPEDIQYQQSKNKISTSNQLKKQFHNKQKKSSYNIQKESSSLNRSDSNEKSKLDTNRYKNSNIRQNQINSQRINANQQLSNLNINASRLNNINQQYKSNSRNKYQQQEQEYSKDSKSQNRNQQKDTIRNNMKMKQQKQKSKVNNNNSSVYPKEQIKKAKGQNNNNINNLKNNNRKKQQQNYDEQERRVLSQQEPNQIQESKTQSQQEYNQRKNNKQKSQNQQLKSKNKLNEIAQNDKNKEEQKKIIIKVIQRKIKYKEYFNYIQQFINHSYVKYFIYSKESLNNLTLRQLYIIELIINEQQYGVLLCQKNAKFNAIVIKSFLFRNEVHFEECLKIGTKYIFNKDPAEQIYLQLYMDKEKSNEEILKQFIKKIKNTGFYLKSEHSIKQRNVTVYTIRRSQPFPQQNVFEHYIPGYSCLLSNIILNKSYKIDFQSDQIESFSDKNYNSSLLMIYTLKTLVSSPQDIANQIENNKQLIEMYKKSEKRQLQLFKRIIKNQKFANINMLNNKLVEEHFQTYDCYKIAENVGLSKIKIRQILEFPFLVQKGYILFTLNQNSGEYFQFNTTKVLILNMQYKNFYIVFFKQNQINSQRTCKLGSQILRQHIQQILSHKNSKKQVRIGIHQFNKQIYGKIIQLDSYNIYGNLDISLLWRDYFTSKIIHDVNLQNYTLFHKQAIVGIYYFNNNEYIPILETLIHQNDLLFI